MNLKRKKPNRPDDTADQGAASPMDVDLLEQIVRLMAVNDLNTVDVRDGARRIILKRGPAVVPMMSMPGAMPASAPAAPATTGQAGSVAAATPAAADDESKLLSIRSPMVGTFYSAPKPGEKPYVNIGATVNDETDVCIIEAMKTFNVHKAGCRGTIAKMLVQDGQTVQFEQPLFLVKPA